MEALQPTDGRWSEGSGHWQEFWKETKDVGGWRKKGGGGVAEDPTRLGAHQVFRSPSQDLQVVFMRLSGSLLKVLRFLGGLHTVFGS